MNHNELMADVLRRNLETLTFHLADFTDADMVVRPVAGANHVAWQVGHLAASEPRLLGMLDPAAGAKAEALLPGGFAGKFTRETAALDDPAAFPTKDEILAALAAVRGASVEWVRSLAPDQLTRPAPENIRGFIPTFDHFATSIADHVMMHVGQIQVVRRKLGKPVLF